MRTYAAIAGIAVASGSAAGLAAYFAASHAASNAVERAEARWSARTVDAIDAGAASLLTAARGLNERDAELLTTAAGAITVSLRAEDAQVLSAPAAPEPVWTDAAKGIITDGLVVSVTGARVEPARVRDVFRVDDHRWRTTREAFLTVDVRMHNTDEARKRDYLGWAATHAAVVLLDEHGNRYRMLPMDASRQVEGMVAAESIYPGGVVVDRLYFEPPVKSATTLRLELPGANAGLASAIRLIMDAPHQAQSAD